MGAATDCSVFSGVLAKCLILFGTELFIARDTWVHGESPDIASTWAFNNKAIDLDKSPRSEP